MCVVLVASQAQETKLHRERSTERKMVEVYVVAKQSDASKVCCYCYVKPVITPLVVLWKISPAVLWKSTRDRDSWKMGEACAAFLSCEEGNHSVLRHDRFIGCARIHVQAEYRCQHLTAHLPETGTFYFLSTLSSLKNIVSQDILQQQT